MSAGELAPVVGVDWLRARGGEVTVADVRWYLDGRSGEDAYEAGHIPGAVFVDLDTVLAGPPSDADGRHPLPDPDHLADRLGRLGIGDDRAVVAYDDASGVVASRLVWMLRVLGHPAAVLDGGLAAWPDALAVGPHEPEPARLTARPWPSDRIAAAADVATAAVVVDARDPARYAGVHEPVDARAGHVPGAVNLPHAGNLDPGTGCFLPVTVLAERYAGLEDPVVYCGSGVSACHDLLAMEAAGVAGARLYPGSWSQWAADPARPVATGPNP